ncbi:hypothetical protein E0H22_02305 [Rhodopseudomonas boonkerdii]|uniref:hypothetical protein n=1 Tax=Rhodopseudomonas boonkerdii TaxID=475937 RepID=UPI001E317253|nr:hypothetical protein [Rhodopseudomonas boonkerdii]UGV24616.1 hypothetical protein E0H22_02305 [Rhodopseudomonas boonkerdii]
MVNSRRLAAIVADALGVPLTSTVQHARNLREAPDGPLIAQGGRGRHVPEMTHDDAAALVCAVMASEAVGASAETVKSLRKLRAQYHGHHSGGRGGRAAEPGMPAFRLDIGPDDDVIRGLAAVLRFFGREDAFLDELNRMRIERQAVWVTFEVEYPQHFASISIGVRNLASQSWTFGKRAFARTEQIRRCRQDALRAIARCLTPS